MIEFMNQKLHCQIHEIGLSAHQSLSIYIQILIFYDKSLQPDGVDLRNFQPSR